MQIGEEVFTRTFTIDRTSLVAYAGASGDFNPIHYNDTAASAAGLPGVLAHGMLTLSLAATAVSDWAGDAGRVSDFGARFTRPVVVPGDGSQDICVTGKIRTLTDTHIELDVRVTCQEATVLSRCRAQVRRVDKEAK